MIDLTRVVTEIEATCLGCGRVERIQGDVASGFVDHLMAAGEKAERERLLSLITSEEFRSQIHDWARRHRQGLSNTDLMTDALPVITERLILTPEADRG